MLKRLIDAFRPYPLVFDFVSNHVRMQFEDVGTILRLPIQACDLHNGCNIASTSVICNLISGISVTIFQPVVFQEHNNEGKMVMIKSGRAFKEFIKSFYPEASLQRRTEIADVLYKQLRNPFAHALGILSKGDFQLEVTRLLSATNDGMTRAEVKAIEESILRPGNIQLGVQGSNKRWTIIADYFYRDALDMMVALANDAIQMEKAEARFKKGEYVWRY